LHRDSTKIIQGRPFSDKSQLVSKKVVSEVTYDRIKAHIDHEPSVPRAAHNKHGALVTADRSCLDLRHLPHHVCSSVDDK